MIRDVFFLFILLSFMNFSITYVWPNVFKEIKENFETIMPEAPCSDECCGDETSLALFPSDRKGEGLLSPLVHEEYKKAITAPQKYINEDLSLTIDNIMKPIHDVNDPQPYKTGDKSKKMGIEESKEVLIKNYSAFVNTHQCVPTATGFFTYCGLEDKPNSPCK